MALVYGMRILDLLFEQGRVFRGVEWKERRSETRRERGSRFGDTAFGTGELRRVSRDEVVQRLVGGEPGNGWKHPEGVGREHDDVFRMPPDATWSQVGQVTERIRNAGVLGV